MPLLEVREAPEIPYLFAVVGHGNTPLHNTEHGITIAIHQVKYLNNLVEQDHRDVKRVTRPMLGFKLFAAAQSTLVGIERMHMRRQGQLEDGGEQGLTAAKQFCSLAA